MKYKWTKKIRCHYLGHSKYKPARIARYISYDGKTLVVEETAGFVCSRCGAIKLRNIVDLEKEYLE